MIIPRNRDRGGCKPGKNRVGLRTECLRKAWTTSANATTLTGKNTAVYPVPLPNAGGRP